MAIPVVAWSSLTDAELDELDQQLGRERQRRRIPQQMDQLQQQQLELVGTLPGQPWRQPNGATEAYPKGWRVSHKGKEWESLTPFNAWEPGADPNGNLWKDLTTVPTAGQWTPGASVTVGQVLSYQGVQYRVIQAHTTSVGWEPPAVPALWARVATATPGTTANRT